MGIYVASRVWEIQVGLGFWLRRRLGLDMWSKVLLIETGTSLPELKKTREITDLQLVLQLPVSKGWVLYSRILNQALIRPKFPVDTFGLAKKQGQKNSVQPPSLARWQMGTRGFDASLSYW